MPIWVRKRTQSHPFSALRCAKATLLTPNCNRRAWQNLMSAPGQPPSPLNCVPYDGTPCAGMALLMSSATAATILSGAAGLPRIGAFGAPSINV
jgi:hypothetical protein